MTQTYFLRKRVSWWIESNGQDIHDQAFLLYHQSTGQGFLAPQALTGVQAHLRFGHKVEMGDT